MQSKLDKYAVVINQMIDNDYSVQDILNELNLLGCKVSYPVVQDWIAKNTGKITPDFEENACDNDCNAAPCDNKSFDFESKFDESLKNDNIAEFLQKAHYFLYKRQLEIVAKEQEDYYLGLSEKIPIQSLRQLQILAGLFYKVAPVHLIANQQEAIRVVERMGYTLNFNETDVYLETDTETN